MPIHDLNELIFSSSTSSTNLSQVINYFKHKIQQKNLRFKFSGAFFRTTIPVT
jgi:hypothetical protein